MKKKLLLILLAANLAVTGLTGCDLDDEEYDSQYDYEDEDSDGDSSGTKEDKKENAKEDKKTDKESKENSNNSGNSTEASSKTGDNRGDSWTVLVYLCGTDLESEGGMASYNLLEMMEADISDKVNLVVETGGASEWQIDGIDTDCLSRYAYIDGELQLVDTSKLASMAKESTLSDFLKWGVKNYPADKYMAVLWDHGGGSVDGLIYDELFDPDESLSIKQVSNAIASTGEIFEVVGFDTCLMSTVENASALSPYARFMVASEEYEPGGGWDYTDWLSYLSSDTTMTGDILGIEIVDSFYKKCETSNEESECTLAVIDLSKVPSLVQSFDSMAKEMKGYTNEVDRIKVITGAFKKAEAYGGKNDNEGYTDMVDLGDLVLNAQGVLSKTGEQVIDDLLSAVVYHKNGSKRSKGEGLSVYVPLSDDEERFDKYAVNAAISGEYLAFLGTLYDFDIPKNVEIVMPVVTEETKEEESETAGEVEIAAEEVDLSDIEDAPEITYRDQKIEYKLFVNDHGYLEADIISGSDIIDGAKCNLYLYDEEEDGFYDLGSDYNVNINDDWTVFEDNFNNSWIYINDCIAVMNAGNWTDDYIEYSVPIMLNNKRTNLKMIYSYDTEEFEIIGVWDGVDSHGFVTREIRQLKDGDVVDFIVNYRESMDSPGEEYIYDGFTVSGPVVVEEDSLGDGTYAYSMTFEDVFGGSVETDWAVIEVVDDEVTFYYE